MTTTPDVTALKAEILKEFPGFNILKKSDSSFMKLINHVLLFITLGKMKTFLTSFITTINNTVYVPADWDTYSPESQCSVLRHERVHMRQARKISFPVFAFLYLLAPIPVFRAHWRTKFEQEAYEESIRAAVDYGSDPTNPVYKLRMVTHFTSSEYFWMWTNEKEIEQWFDTAVVKAVAAGKLTLPQTISVLQNGWPKQ